MSVCWVTFYEAIAIETHTIICSVCIVIFTVFLEFNDGEYETPWFELPLDYLKLIFRMTKVYKYYELQMSKTIWEIYTFVS